MWKTYDIYFFRKRFKFEFETIAFTENQVK